MLFDARQCDLLCSCEVTGMLAAAALCAWTVSGSEIELFSNFWCCCNLLGNCLAHGCGVSSVAFFFKNTFVTSPNFTCDSFGMSAEM